MVEVTSECEHEYWTSKWDKVLMLVLNYWSHIREITVKLCNNQTHVSIGSEEVLSENKDFMCVSLGCRYAPPHISCSPGESVLLSCVDVHSQYKDIQWWYSVSDVNNPECQLSPDHCSKGRCYTNRLHVNINLSLSITDLTIEDTGKYWCKITKDADNNKYIALTIEGEWRVIQLWFVDCKTSHDLCPSAAASLIVKG